MSRAYNGQGAVSFAYTGTHAVIAECTSHRRRLTSVTCRQKSTIATHVQRNARDIFNARRLSSRHRYLISEDISQVEQCRQTLSKPDLAPDVQERTVSADTIRLRIQQKHVIFVVSSSTFKRPVLLLHVDHNNTDGTSLHMPTVRGILNYIVLVE